MQTNTDSNSLDCQDNLNRGRLELVEVVFSEYQEIRTDSEHSLYPWEYYRPEAETFFDQRAAKYSCVKDINQEELEEETATFFAAMEDCWSEKEKKSSLQALQKKFGELVPSDWLDKIALQVEATMVSELSHAKRLIECVGPLFPDWEESDLLVFTRPLVSAMRNNSDVSSSESLLQSLQPKAWADYSSIEKARLSIAIAHYAICQAKNQN